VPQYYLIPKQIARAYPTLGKFAQWMEAQLFRFIFWFMGRLSPQRAAALSAFVFGWVGRFSDKAKKADTNLSIAFPERPEEWRRETVQQIFRSLGKSVAELIQLDQIWKECDQRVEFVLHPQAKAHIEARRASVFVSAHIGAWQVTTLLSPRYGLSTSTIYAAESNVALREMMLKRRESFSAKLISTDAGVRPLLRELKKGACIGLAMDTRLDTGQLIPFFGREALTNTSIPRLALGTNAALLPIRGERLGKGKYRVTVYDPIVAEAADATVDEQAISMSAQVNDCFESWIRDNPGQWICLKRRWPKAHKL
jgi:KDO2-lipid IV(A) lauroyltransferase